MRNDGTAQYKSPNEFGFSNILSSSWLSTSGTHRFIYEFIHTNKITQLKYKYKTVNYLSVGPGFTKINTLWYSLNRCSHSEKYTIKDALSVLRNQQNV